MTRLHTVADLARLLDERAADVVRKLLPGGHREGPLWVEASRSKGGLGDSLKVHIAGPKQGRWTHYGGGGHGDMMELVCFTTGRSKAEAIAWTKAELGLDGIPDTPAARRRAQDRAAEDKRRLARKHKEAAAAEAESGRRRRDAARGIWAGAKPAIIGTPADRYLHRRGIDLRRLARVPGALRFCPDLKVPGGNGSIAAAMVAAVSGPDGFMGIHRTFLGLVRPKTGAWGKRVMEDGGPAKRTLGPILGGCIPVWRGDQMDPDTGEVKPGRAWSQLFKLKNPPCGEPDILLCEGIEDALILALARPDCRVLAGVSLGHMGALVLPPMLRGGGVSVTLVPDNDDEDNRAAARGLDAALAGLARQTDRLHIARPPAGAKDVNDMIEEVG